MPLFNLCALLIREFKLDEPAPLFIQFFMDKVFEFSKNNHENLSAFLQWWEQNGAKCSAVLPEGTNAVRIMTIHAAKGLQFPVVIFAFADWETFKSDLIWAKSTDPELPQLNNVLVKANSKLSYTPFADEYINEKNKQLLDNVNLFYVASTRPEQHLHIIARDRQKSNFVDAWLRKFTSEKKLLIPDTNGFQYGRMEKKQVENPSSSTSSTDVLQTKILWKELDASRLLYLPPSQKKNEKIEAKRKEGILFHMAMAQIHSQNDIEKAKRWLVAKGHCSSSKANHIASKIKSLFMLEFFQNLFPTDAHAVNEPEILSEKGSIRPDRIIFEKDKTRIIDYKTGSERSDYHEQLHNYATALEDCGYPSSEKIIVYVEEEKMEMIA